MTLKLSSFVVLATFLITTAAHADAALEQRIKEAREAFVRGDVAAAYERYLAIWATNKSGRIAGLLAQAEVELGRCADAIRHLDLAIADPPADGTEDVLRLLRGWRAQCESRVQQVTVSGVEPGTDVVVDGEVVGQAPLPSAIMLDPGLHQIEARRAGETVATASVNARAGATQVLTLPASQPPPSSSGISSSSSASPYVPSSPPALERKPPMWPAYVGGGVFLVGLATGVGFHLAAESKESEVEDHLDELTPNSCGGASQPARCRDLADAVSAHDSRRLWSDIGTGAAIVAGVATASYVIWAHLQSPKTTVSASVGPRGDGGVVLVHGRF